MIALGLAFAGVASVGVVLVVSAQSTEDIKHGEALVTRNCARCHAKAPTRKRRPSASSASAIRSKRSKRHSAKASFRATRIVGAIIAYLKSIQVR